jgi:hypothetical protein
MDNMFKKNNFKISNGIKWLIGVFGSKKARFVALSYAKNFDVNSAESKAILKDLATYCNFEKSSFDTNPYTMAFNEGARDVLLHILEMSKIKQEELISICEEFNKNEV